MYPLLKYALFRQLIYDFIIAQSFYIVNFWNYPGIKILCNKKQSSMGLFLVPCTPHLTSCQYPIIIYLFWNVEYDTLWDEFKQYEQPLNYMTYGEFLKCFVVSLIEFVISNNDTFSDGRRPCFFRNYYQIYQKLYMSMVFILKSH